MTDGNFSQSENIFTGIFVYIKCECMTYESDRKTLIIFLPCNAYFCKLGVKGHINHNLLKKIIIMSCDCKLSVCVILFTFFCLCFSKFLFSNCCS